MKALDSWEMNVNKKKISHQETALSQRGIFCFALLISRLYTMHKPYLCILSEISVKLYRVATKTHGMVLIKKEGRVGKNFIWEKYNPYSIYTCIF